MPNVGGGVALPAIVFIVSQRFLPNLCFVMQRSVPKPRGGLFEGALPEI
jgi:hypothetical protein